MHRVRLHKRHHATQHGCMQSLMCFASCLHRSMNADNLFAAYQSQVMTCIFRQLVPLCEPSRPR